MPMRMCNLAYAEMTEALNRGWGDRNSRSVMLLQQERAGIKRCRGARAAARSDHAGQELSVTALGPL